MIRAGHDTVEITPEMIEAGVLKLFDYDPRFSNEKEIVTLIFSSMLAKRAIFPPSLDDLHQATSKST
jgi:hypothetical protein